MTLDSLFVVPVLTVWNMLPLIYFVAANRIVTAWCVQIRKAIKRDKNFQIRPIRFYYDQFINLTEIQEQMANFFNPFILFSLTWAVFVLCLSIYFVTQTNHHFDMPPYHIIAYLSPHSDPVGHYLNQVTFNMIYYCLQVFLAILTVICICFTGCFTNEETRNIMKEVLRNVPEEGETPLGDRFFVSCFVYKLNCQITWGVSAWRAFPLERSVFFTLVSLVLTYSFLLLKFKQSTSSAFGNPGNDTLS